MGSDRMIISYRYLISIWPNPTPSPSTSLPLLTYRNHLVDRFPRGLETHFSHLRFLKHMRFVSFRFVSFRFVSFRFVCRRGSAGEERRADQVSGDVRGWLMESLGIFLLFFSFLETIADQVSLSFFKYVPRVWVRMQPNSFASCHAK